MVEIFVNVSKLSCPLFSRWVRGGRKREVCQSCFTLNSSQWGSYKSVNKICTYINECHFRSTFKLKVLSSYLTSIEKINFCLILQIDFRLISQINLRSNILRFYRDMKYTFLHDRKRNLSATQWYIFFSLILIQTWIIARSLGVYSNFSTITSFILEKILYLWVIMIWWWWWWWWWWW